MNKKLYLFLLLSIALCSCKKESIDSTKENERIYKMGFQLSAPRLDINLALQSLYMWEQRSDAAIISTEVPWDSLFNGTTPEEYVLSNYKALVDYYRGKNFELWVYIDPANGLNRSSDATSLVNLHKSIAQQDVQNLYRRFVCAMDSILQPEHLGLALETNLIRGYSPDSIYQGIKTAANAASVDVRRFDQNVKLSVSVQVDYAWTVFNSSSQNPIDKDFADFPFVEELGLSSYPYFSFDKPQDIPLNYYSGLLTNRSLHVFISEQGWASVSVDNVVASPEKQRDYVTRQAQLLSQVNAIGLFQLTFTDIDMSGQANGYPADLYLFASIGFVDINLNPKPSLEAWDSIFKRKLVSK